MRWSSAYISNHLYTETFYLLSFKCQGNWEWDTILTTGFSPQHLEWYVCVVFFSKFTLENWTWVVRLVLRISLFSRIGLEWCICVSTFLCFALQVRAVQEVVDKLKGDGHHVRFPFWFHIIFPFNFHMIFPLYQRGRPSCEISNIKISCRSARDLWGFS